MPLTGIFREYCLSFYDLRVAQLNDRRNEGAQGKLSRTPTPPPDALKNIFFHFILFFALFARLVVRFLAVPLWVVYCTFLR